jgi:signal transduction histidine kinase
MSKRPSQLDDIVKYIIDISNGKSTLTEENISEEKDEQCQYILTSLLFMNQELEFSARLRQENLALSIKNKTLIEKSKEAEQFVYLASHDLKSPLLNVKSLLELVENDEENNLSNDSATFIKQGILSATRMAQLIDNLLDYAKLDILANIQLIDPIELIKQVAADLSGEILESNVIIDVSDNLPKINGDNVKIGALFQNIISNAIKYSKEGKSTIKITALQDGSNDIFCVEDNGIGIAKNDIHRLFDFFVRTGSSNKYQGSGIGLAHCKKIMQIHGGSIWVESEEGKYSKFLLSFPKPPMDK